MADGRDDMRAIPLERLRKLRDIVGALGADDLAAALQELIHLRYARVMTVDGVTDRSAGDVRLVPDMFNASPVGPIDKAEIFAAFHKLWTHHTGGADYSKQMWKALASALGKIGIG